MGTKEAEPVNMVTARKRKPLYGRAWPIAPLLVLAVVWMVATFLPTTSQDDLVPERRAWTLMGTTLEATVYRPASARSLARTDLGAVYSAVIDDQRMSPVSPR